MRIARIAIQSQAVWAHMEDGCFYPLSAAPYEGGVRTGERVDADAARLLAPATPSKVVCVGLNYHDHIAEMKHDDVPADPVLFIKPSTSVVGPGEAIVRPSFSGRVDHESELAVVIAKAMKGVSERDALSYVLGYTCLNDVTARDLQKQDGQWTRAKGQDTFCPIGPWIETDADPGNVTVQAIVGEQVRQSSSTKLLITPVAKLLSFISAGITLLPGDVVATGTPAGVGPLLAGETVRIVISGIGTLENPVL